MKKFLVTAKNDICRNGQILNFNKNFLLGKEIIDKLSEDEEWDDFETEFVIDTCVLCDSASEAIRRIAEDYEIKEEFLKAYELV